MWFRVPNQIYFNMNAVENLRQFPSRSTVIVTNPALEQIGHVDIVRRYLPPETPVHVSVIPEAEPEVKVVMHGVEALNFYKAGPDHRAGRRVGDRRGEDHEAQVRIAGGGPGGTWPRRSWISASAWSSIPPKKPTGAVDCHLHHQRNGERSHSVRGADRTRERGRKVTLADYSLSPDVAIVDPQFVMSMPKRPHGGYRASTV